MNVVKKEWFKPVTNDFTLGALHDRPRLYFKDYDLPETLKAFQLIERTKATKLQQRLNLPIEKVHVLKRLIKRNASNLDEFREGKRPLAYLYY